MSSFDSTTRYVSALSRKQRRQKAMQPVSVSMSGGGSTPLGGVVTLTGDQEISGLKDFANGLNIGGLPIRRINENTVFIDANVVFGGAATMFGKDSTSFPTIWANIPFNPEHMTWDGSQWSVAGGGVADSVAWTNITGKPTWIGATKPSYKYSEIDETPDLSIYATQSWVTGTAKAYDSARLNGKSSSYYVGQQYYNTKIDANSATRNHISHSHQWANAPESDIQSLLDISYSADWRTQLMAHHLTQSLYARYFYNGSTWSKWAKFLDSENFSDYALPKVGGDITGTLNVGGRLTLNNNAIFKHASNPFLGLYSTDREEYWYVQGTSSGLKLGSTSANSIVIDKSGVLQVLEELRVGNLSIKKSQDKTIYIDGNLVVSGAMTMFGKDSTTFPTIWANIPFNPKHMTWDGSQWSVAGGGVADSVAWTNITGKPTWIGATKPSYKYSEIDETPDLSIYATQSWVTGKGYITSSASITGNAGSATKLASARTLWGQAFDGTAGLTGSLTVTTGEGYRINYNGYDLRFIVSGTSANRGIWDNTNSEWMVYRSSSTNIIFPQGNIAIGSHNAPADRLTVTGSIASSEALKLTATPSNAFEGAQILLAGGKSRIGVATSGFMGLYADSFTFRPSSTTSASASSFTIDANANLATTGKLTLPTGASNYTNASLWFGDSVRIGVNSSNSLGIFAGSAIRLNPDSSTMASATKGLWLLNSGFNGVNNSSPTEALDVVGNIKTSGKVNVNGGIIEYNSTHKAWQMYGDLVITGAVTMFGNINGFTPSTITDAVMIDNTTIKRNAGGSLYAVMPNSINGDLAISGRLTTQNNIVAEHSSNPFVALKRDGTTWYCQVTSSGIKLGQTSAKSINVDASGNLTAVGSITPNTSSDERLKRNLRKFNASEVLMSLGGVWKYEYIDSEVKSNHIYEGTHYGLIYQNVIGSPLSSMCHEREDGYGSLNYINKDFISIIAGATMENISEIEKLKKENKVLKKRVEQLENELHNGDTKTKSS